MPACFTLDTSTTIKVQHPGVFPAAVFTLMCGHKSGVVMTMLTNVNILANHVSLSQRNTLSHTHFGPVGTLETHFGGFRWWVNLKSEAFF